MNLAVTPCYLQRSSTCKVHSNVGSAKYAAENIHVHAHAIMCSESPFNTCHLKVKVDTNVGIEVPIANL